jgi:hypothetical protein
MCRASWRRCPLAAVFATRSLPARSTRKRIPLFSPRRAGGGARARGGIRGSEKGGGEREKDGVGRRGASPAVSQRDDEKAREQTQGGARSLREERRVGTHLLSRRGQSLRALRDASGCCARAHSSPPSRDGCCPQPRRRGRRPNPPQGATRGRVA